MNEYCSNLDNYLLGDLSPADAAAFAEHLGGCEECREAFDQQQWINDLLQGSSQLDAEVPPPHIAAELRAATVRRESFRKRAITIAFASAAALLVAVTWLLNHPTGNTPQHVATTTDVPTAPEPPYAMFVAGGDAIAVPIKSRHPDVTIVRVYSTFQPLDTSKMAAFQPESNKSNTMTDFSNGGS
jgi:predicted anti-sigma-YlaC factor YlaD